MYLFPNLLNISNRHSCAGVLRCSKTLLSLTLRRHGLVCRALSYIQGKTLLITFVWNSPYAAHTHPPQTETILHGNPGALSPNAPGPADALPISQLNEHYMQQRQGVHDRLEAESRGYDSVFSQ